jgi:hypothetical protein
MGSSQNASLSSAANGAPAPSAPQGPAHVCGTCVHMGRIYHDGGLEPDHSCAKSDERRAAAMKPTGDLAEDFMRNWRVFFDATPRQRACTHHEPRPRIDDESLRVLRLFEPGKYGSAFAQFRFLSSENTACERMDRLYVQASRSPDGPTKFWRLTPFGQFVLRENTDASSQDGQGPVRPEAVALDLGGTPK